MRDTVLADKVAIAKVIPHAGSMCLLDAVLECDERHICCVSSSHRNLDNPMRFDNELSALCGIEYAAQAMAVHGVLGGQIDKQPRAGYLASLRDVSCHVMRLDILPDDLVVSAEKLMGDEARVIYQFALHAGGSEILTGRATVVLDVGVVTV